MARYIDLDEAIKHLQFDCKAKYPLSYCNGISVAINEIGRLPNEDVVPKSEFNKTIAEWAYLHADVLNKLENAKAEVAREIFEEIENMISPMLGLEDDKEYVAILSKNFAELKKKYTEGEK